MQITSNLTFFQRRAEQWRWKFWFGTIHQIWHWA